MHHKTAETQQFPIRASFFFLFLYISIVYLLTLTPFHFSKFYLHQYLLFKKGYLATLTGTTSLQDILINLFMLFPVGFIIASLLKATGNSLKTALLLGTGTGFFISVSIEISQIFLPRVSSTIDILNNTLGAALGVGIVYFSTRFRPEKFLLKIKTAVKPVYHWLVLFYSLILTVIFILPSLINNFSNWQSNYPFLIGNENTRDRPWQGTIYKLSIFNRALNQKDIRNLASVPFQTTTPAEFSKNLIVEYIFSSLILQNQVENGISLKLQVEPLSYIFQFPNQPGLHIRGNSALKSPVADSQLVKLFQKTNQLSLAIWIKPQNLKQSGPARIVSLSLDPKTRNFTLGQVKDRINFRVRTPLTGTNGAKVSLLSHSILSSNYPQFIAVTYNRGEARLFSNGKKITTIVYDVRHYLPLLFRFENKQFHFIEICFVLLFPFGWIIRELPGTLIRRKYFIPLMMVIPYLISTSFKVLFFRHLPDIYLLAIHLLILSLVLCSGLFYEFLITAFNKKF